MTGDALGSYVTAARPPAPVAAARLLLLVLAGITLVTTLGVLLATPVTAELFGVLVWSSWPGVVAAWAAVRPSPRQFVAVLVVAGGLLVMTMGAFANGDPRGLSGLLIPVTLLVLVLRRSSRRFFGVGLPASRSGGSREGGATSIEYIGVLGVVALVIGALVLAISPPQVIEGARRLICAVTSTCDAGPGDVGPGGTAEAAPAGPAVTGPEPWCAGWGCVGAVGEQVGSGLFNVGRGAWDDLVGVGEVIMDPGLILDAVGYVIENPGDALRQLVWDDESAAMWESGDVGGALGRTLWNVGSWFIPGYNVGKLGAKLGALGRLGALLASQVDAVLDISRRAVRAADAGDVDEAARLAEQARSSADDVAADARRTGCLTAGHSSSPVLVLAAGPPGSGWSGATSRQLVLAADCDGSADAVRTAQDAARTAVEAANDSARRAEIARRTAAGEDVPADFDLGWDPDVRRYRQNEYDTARRLAAARGVELRRAPADASGYDWFDAQGRTYDAVGNFPAQFFDEQWPNLQRAIIGHMSKADFVPVDVAGLSPAQIAQVREFIAPLGDRVFVIGG